MSSGVSSKPSTLSTSSVTFDTPSKEISTHLPNKPLLSVAKSIDFTDVSFNRQSSSDCIILKEKKRKDLFFTVKDIKFSGKLYEYVSFKS